MKKLILSIALFSFNFAYCQQCVTMNYCLNFNDTLCLSHLFIDTSSYPGNIWQIGRPQKPLFDSIGSPSSQRVIVTDTLNPYPVNTISAFIIRNIVSMGDYYGLKIFNGMYDVQTDSLNDFGRLEFSPDNGNTWINLIEDTVYAANFTWMSGKPIFTGKSNGWKSFELILADLGSLFNIQIGDTTLFRFTFQSDSIQENLGGLMFDNICFYDFVEGVTEVRFKNIKSKIYPNPSNNIFIIEFENPFSETYQLSIYDNHSKLVYSKDTISENKISINAQEFKSGIYYYKLTNLKDRKRCWGKFITIK